MLLCRGTPGSLHSRGSQPRTPPAPPAAPQALTERRHGAGLQQQAVLAAASLQQGARPRLLLPEQPQPFAQSHGSRGERGSLWRRWRRSFRGNSSGNSSGRPAPVRPLLPGRRAGGAVSPCRWRSPHQGPGAPTAARPRRARGADPPPRERPSPLLPALLFPPAVNFPESTLSLWLGSSGSSSSGTGRSRRRALPPPCPARREGRSGRTRQRCGPGPARLFPAQLFPARPFPSPELFPARLSPARPCRSPAPRVARPPWSRPGGAPRGAAVVVPGPGSGRAPSRLPPGPGAAPRRSSPRAAGPPVQSSRERHSARVLLLQGAHHNSLWSLSGVSAVFSRSSPRRGGLRK